MTAFLDQIAKALPTRKQAVDRHWVYLPYDRLTDRAGPLHDIPPAQAGLILVESAAKGHRREYHKKKIALLLSNERHFALEQAARGIPVLYAVEQGTHGEGLLRLQAEYNLPQITVMKPAERELRIDLEHARAGGLRLNEIEDPTWLSSESDFDSVFKLRPNADGHYDLPNAFVMDRFYRAMRKKSGILMQHNQPIGASFSFDVENRQAYKNQVPVPARPSFAPDDITNEVLELVEREYPHTFGVLEGFDFPVTASQCDTFWKFALDKLLPTFGPYEDAMRDDHLDLFHSKTSALVNLSRILPRDLVDGTAAAYAKGKIPLASAEGFIRQVLGWREFMRHLHRVTDGYRMLPASKPVYKEKKVAAPSDAYTGAAPSALHATRRLPAAYWGAKSGLHCLDTVVEQVIHEGWSHHITRLMVLSNLATLCGFSPRELTDWFWFAYVDAYDWVVEPNVLGMATYGDGGLTATKPYVSGAAYINRMSNYCGHCQYDPKKSTGPGSCPFTALYWTFLERNQDLLGKNIRLAMPYNTLRKKTAAERKALHERADEAIAALEAQPRPTY